MLTIARVLLAGGEEADQSGLRQVLESAGHVVSHAATLEEATHRVLTTDISVLVLTNGMEQSLEQLVSARCGDSAAVVVLLRRPTVAGVRDALRAGASDVVDASAEEYVLLAAIERAARDGQLRRELSMLRARVGDASKQSLVGRSTGMAHVRELIGRAAGSRAPVVIAGEPGTGKDAVARLVHDLSERASQPYATVRCGVDQATLERELFGATASGYSSAGLLERVRGGTVVLEDASSLSLNLRARLSRVGLTRQTQRVGGSDSLPADVRLILVVRTGSGDGAEEVQVPRLAALARDDGRFTSPARDDKLLAFPARDDGRFASLVRDDGQSAVLGRDGDRRLSLVQDDGRRAALVPKDSGQAIDDLLHAFNAMLIEVPPLRERRSDIPQLVNHFRRRVATEQGVELPPMSPDDMLPLLGREWTGNVRELEHWVERAAFATPAERSPAGANPSGIDFGHAQVTLERLERAYILHVLQREGGHQSRAAERLGIDRRTLYRKLKQYRLEVTTQK